MLAGLPLTGVLDGDDSLRRRPVARIIEPLRRMGAELHARDDDSLPPLTVVGHTPLRAVDVTTPVPSAQVKSAILLAALRAEGRTTVRERVATRDHTERMLRARGVPVDRVVDGDGGVAWTVEGGTAVRAIDQRVPGDVSAAAFWLVAGSIHPDAELTLHDVGVNPTRRAVIDLLRAMGADIEERPIEAAAGFARDAGAAGADPDAGEPMADLIVRSSDLRAIDLSPADVAAAIDKIPGCASPRPELVARPPSARPVSCGTRSRTASPASPRASGRWAPASRSMATTCASKAARASRGATTDSLDDHRLAMTFAIAGLVATDPMTIERPDSAAVSYPGFFSDLEGVRA